MVPLPLIASARKSRLKNILLNRFPTLALEIKSPCMSLHALVLTAVDWCWSVDGLLHACTPLYPGADLRSQKKQQSMQRLYLCDKLNFMAILFELLWSEIILLFLVVERANCMNYVNCTMSCMCPPYLGDGPACTPLYPCMPWADSRSQSTNKRPKQCKRPTKACKGCISVITWINWILWQYFLNYYEAKLYYCFW